MKVRLDDCSSKEPMSVWCIEQAIKNAFDNSSTFHLVVLNNLSGVTKAYDAIRQLYPKIKAHWPANICCLSNGSQIRLITTHQFLKENSNYNLNLRCALYFPEELQKFNFSISCKDKRPTDMCVRVFTSPMLYKMVADLPIVVEIDFNEFLTNNGTLVFPNIFKTIAHKMNLLCGSTEIIRVNVGDKIPPSCKNTSGVCREKHCWFVGKAIIVGNNCPCYTEFYLEALRQQGRNFSLISGTMQKQ